MFTNKDNKIVLNFVKNIEIMFFNNFKKKKTRPLISMPQKVVFPY